MFQSIQERGQRERDPTGDRLPKAPEGSRTALLTPGGMCAPHSVLPPCASPHCCPLLINHQWLSIAFIPKSMLLKTSVTWPPTHGSHSAGHPVYHNCARWAPHTATCTCGSCLAYPILSAPPSVPKLHLQGPSPWQPPPQGFLSPFSCHQPSTSKLPGPLVSPAWRRWSLLSSYMYDPPCASSWSQPSMASFFSSEERHCTQCVQRSVTSVLGGPGERPGRVALKSRPCDLEKVTEGQGPQLPHL